MTKKNAKKDAARARQEAQGGKYQHHLRQEGGGGPRVQVIPKFDPADPRAKTVRLANGAWQDPVRPVEIINGERRTIVWISTHEEGRAGWRLRVTHREGPWPLEDVERVALEAWFERFAQGEWPDRIQVWPARYVATRQAWGDPAWWRSNEAGLEPLTGLEHGRGYETSDSGLAIVRGAEASYWASRIMRPTRSADREQLLRLFTYLMGDPISAEESKPKLSDGTDLPESERQTLLRAVVQALASGDVPDQLLTIAKSLSTDRPAVPEPARAAPALEAPGLGAPSGPSDPLRETLDAMNRTVQLVGAHEFTGAPADDFNWRDQVDDETAALIELQDDD